MNLHVLAGIISGILALSTMFPYLRSIFWGTTRPSIISQSLWAITALITVTGQYFAAGPSWSMAIPLAYAFNNTVIVVICLCGYGYRGHSTSDFASAFLAILGLTLWYLTSTPLYAVIFGVLAGICAGFPTYHKTFKHPESENTFSWLIVLASGVFSLLSVQVIVIASVVYPVFTILEAALVSLLSLQKLSKVSSSRLSR